MATAPIDVAIKVKGLSDLQKLEKRMDSLEKEVARLTKQLPKAANGIRQTGRAAATATGNIQRMGVAIRTTLGPIVGLYAAFNFLNKSLQVAGRRQVDVAKLTNGLKNLGATASDFERLQVAADNFGNSTLFDQEEATQAFALLTSFQRIGVESYERVTKAASDLATVTGQDLKSAQIQLAKALEDPAKRVTDLARSGTVFTDQQKEQIKVLQESGRLFEAQALILREIEKQYGGAAEAAGSAGLAGALDSLGEATRDFQEQLVNSTLLIDGTTEAIRLLTDAIGVASEKLKELNTIFEAIAILAKEAGLGTIDLADAIDFVQEAALNAVPGLKQLLWLYERVVDLSGRVVDSTAGPRNFGKDYASEERALFEAAGGFSPYKSTKKSSPSPVPPKTTKSGGSKGKGRESRLPQLNQEIAAAEKLLNVERQLLEAQFEGNTEQIRALEAGKLKIEYENELAAIALEKIPALEAEAKAKLAALEYAGQELELQNQIKTEEQDRLETLEERLTAFDREIELAGVKDDLAKDLLRIEHDIVDMRNQGLLVGEQEIAQYRARAQAAAQAQNQGQGNKVQQYMQQLRDELDDTEGMIVSLAQTVEGEIGSAMSNAITGLIDGTKTAQEAFADMFKNIGKAFIDMATQMIAKALVMKALGILTGGGGGGGFMLGGGGGFGGTNYGMGGAGLFSFSGGGYTGSGARSGGVDGQGGFPAILHPQETVVDHRGAMNRFSSGGGAGGGNANITVQTGDVLRFNNDDYVSMADFEAGMKQAAKQGASSGYSRTMSTLKNSRSQRSKLGMR